jgi:lysophospholipase L1-like esterase
VTDQAMAVQTPHIVLLMIGTNDLNGNVNVDQAPTRLGNLIDQITGNAPEALVVVATIIPIENGNGPKVGPYNDSIAGLVATRAEQGAHVTWVDNHAAFTANANYASALMPPGDTLHPNDAGYAVLGDSFYEAIQTFLPQAP